MEISYRRTMQVQAYESVALEVRLNEDECKNQPSGELTKHLMAEVDKAIEQHVKELQLKDETLLPDF